MSGGKQACSGHQEPGQVNLLSDVQPQPLESTRHDADNGSRGEHRVTWTSSPQNEDTSREHVPSTWLLMVRVYGFQLINATAEGPKGCRTRVGHRRSITYTGRDAGIQGDGPGGVGSISASSGQALRLEIAGI